MIREGIEFMSSEKQNLTIMIVDDEIDLAEIIAEDLEDHGYKVAIATSGDEAMTIVKNEKIDFILSDIKMPNGTGKELLVNIRNYNSELPVVVLMSGYSELTESELTDLGASALMAKPVSSQQIVEFIEKTFNLG